jgi:aromatic-L-amino-acid/L-tryptophan decarboxylase
MSRSAGPPRAVTGPESDPLALDAETMRRLGHAVVDRVVERLTGLDAQPAWRWAPRQELETRWGGPPPAQPTDPAALLELLTREVLPLASSVDHPRFFGYIPGSATWPGILADWLATAYNVFAGTSQASSGPSTLELQVLEWFRQWVGLPTSAQGILTSGGSAANLIALVAAREAWLSDPTAGGAAHTVDAATPADATQRLTRAMLYYSDQTHSSMVRAARIAGFRDAQLRELPTGADFRLDPRALRAAVETDRAAGREPFLVVANAGATSTGAVDPLPELARLCNEMGLWLHVDAAYGGFAVLTERGRQALLGMDLADSLVLDPHKWLYQPFEAGCVLLRDGAVLGRAFHVMPDYLQDTAVAGAEINLADRGLQLTRSARGLKIWLSLRSFGVPAFARVIDRALDLAAEAAAHVAAAPELEMLSTPALGVICFRRHPPGTDDEATLEAINAALVAGLRESGLGLISSTRLHGRYALRVCVLNHGSTSRDVARVMGWLATSPVASTPG